MSNNGDNIDWKQCFKNAVIYFGIKPADFWQLSITEYIILSHEFFDNSNNPITRDEFLDLQKVLKTNVAGH